jgi:hypothetical protein
MLYMPPSYFLFCDISDVLYVCFQSCLTFASSFKKPGNLFLSIYMSVHFFLEVHEKLFPISFILNTFGLLNNQHSEFFCTYSCSTDYIWYGCLLFFTLHVAMTWSCRSWYGLFLVYGYVFKNCMSIGMRFSTSILKL